MPNALYNFAGVSFGPFIQDWVPRTNRTMNVSLRHIPYSDVNILDLGGRNPNTFSAVVIVEDADHVAFQALLGVTASLMLNGNTHPSATLTKLESHEMTPLDNGTRKHRYQAEWVLE
jgi:hypothetical protein